MVRIELSEIEVMAWVRDPFNTVPKVYNVIINNRTHPITIDVVEKEGYLQREMPFLDESREVLEQLARRRK